MDLIGRSIAAAVSHNLAGPHYLDVRLLTKKIPPVSLRKLLFNPQLRKGNVPALFADLTEEYGPVFQISPPFAKPMIFLGGPETNQWVHRRGRMYLRARDYFADFEKVYGASGVLPALDGADHFRLRKSLSAAYSRKRLAGQMDELYDHARKYMANWKVGDSYPATSMNWRMINAQISPLMVGVETQDIIDDLLKFKERALSVHIMKVLPKVMLKTPGMRRRAKNIATLLERIQSVHTPAQRAGAHRNLVDDYLSLHASDPQFVPESNLRFAFTAGVGSLRMYPIVPMSMRHVMNSCVVEDCELPVGSKVIIAQTASHYMKDVFPDPFKFDIDLYLPPRNEHRSPGYAPYGLGTHTCLGSRWMELQLAVNGLMVAHYFTLKVSPENFKLRFNPLPSMKPSKKLKFLIAEQRHKLPA